MEKALDKAKDDLSGLSEKLLKLQSGQYFIVVPFKDF